LRYPNENVEEKVIYPYKKERLEAFYRRCSSAKRKAIKVTIKLACEEGNPNPSEQLPAGLS